MVKALRLRFVTYILFTAVLLVFTGCGRMVRTNAIKSISEIFGKHFYVFTSETDPVLAESGIGANLKLLDVLIAEDPNNTELLLLAAKSYSLYTFFFVEGKEVLVKDSGQRKILSERAVKNYKKAVLYGERALNIAYNNLYYAWNKGEKALNETLDKESDIEPDMLFWLAYSVGAQARINNKSSESIVKLGRAVVLMEALLKRNETFFYCGPHLFFGVYYASTPVFAGGSSQKSKEHFDKAKELTGNNFLLVPYLAARYYAETTLQRDVFEKELSFVINAPNDLLPSAELANVMSKRWAAELIKEAEDIF